jgi:Tfp pilus assembly protein PilW
MISLVLGLMILNGFFILYVSIEKNNDVIFALTTIENNETITHALLDRDIRATGDLGCTMWQEGLPFHNGTSFTVTSENRIEPYVTDEMKSGTEGFIVRHASLVNGRTLKAMQTNDVLSVTEHPAFSSGDLLFISDCKSIDFFIAKLIEKHAGSQTITAFMPLSRTYHADAEVGRFEINAYFISQTDRFDALGQPINALYIKQGESAKKELVEGIDSMEIMYDISEEGQRIKVSSNELTDGSKVTGVSIKMIFSSLDVVSLQKTDYLYVALQNKK